MKERMFAGSGKNIFAIIATGLFFLEPFLNIEWELIKYDVMVLVRLVTNFKNVAVYMPLIILAVLITAKMKYKLKGTLFSLPFLYLTYFYGSVFYAHLEYLKANEYPLFSAYAPTQRIIYYGIITVGMLLIFAGSVWRFKLWPLITAGGLISFGGAAYMLWHWGGDFLKAPAALFSGNSIYAPYRVSVLEFLIACIFYISIAILPLNFKKRKENIKKEPEAEGEEKPTEPTDSQISSATDKVEAAKTPSEQPSAPEGTARED